MEKKADYYDKAYAERPEYKTHYTCSYYIYMWTIVLDKLKTLDNPSILELGCGTGQFAHYLKDNGFSSYMGVDFSEIAIDTAKRMSDQLFIVADIFDVSIYNNFDVVILLEVLEHLDKDIELLDKIPSGQRVIFSVPTFDDPAHVRFFKDFKEVMERYTNINIKNIDISNRIIICDGYKH